MIWLNPNQHPIQQGKIILVKYEDSRYDVGVVSDGVFESCIDSGAYYGKIVG